MQRANIVPFGSVGGEVAGGVFGAGLAHVFEALLIFGEHRIVGVEPGRDVARHGSRLSRRRQSKEGPGAFTAALD